MRSPISKGINRTIKVTNASATPTIEDQVPKQEELSRILRISPPRVRVVEALMGAVSLRGVLGHLFSANLPNPQLVGLVARLCSKFVGGGRSLSNLWLPSKLGLSCL